MSKALRADLVFSYWIYLWFILYVFKFTQYNPKFIIILALIENAIMLVLMFLYGTSRETIFYFILINTLIKVVPYYYLRNIDIKLKDIYATIIFFIIFNIWLYLNKQNLVGNVKLIHDSLIFGKIETPFMSILEKIKNNFKYITVV
jgi:hypothetical protein